ncbi:MAG TPA: lysophospholipid acyltransferase family protein [Ohtaekwangia sp.]|nr:lysophospholipid acyltransferase family protein [Ohtaekwangia sp.]
MFFVRLISRLPFAVLYIISDFLFLISYRVIRYRRRMTWKNLTNAFPDKSENELRAIEKEFYKNLCDYAVETLKLLTISREELAKRMVFENPELVVDLIAKGHSVWMLASHQFNWEWLLVRGGDVYPMPLDFVYQPVESAFFEKISHATRTRFGNYAIKRDEVAREIVKRRRIQRGICIVADQYPGYEHDKKYLATFLNQETAFFYGTQQLATMTQYPAVFYAMKKVKRGYYETTVVEVAMPPYPKDDNTVINRYIQVAEQVIRENPSGWLWSHNRWKKRHLKEKTKSDL